MATDLKEPLLDSVLLWLENGSLNQLSLSDDFYDDDDDCEYEDDDLDMEPNEFALGYRWVKKGRKQVQVPLTEEDWIHPKDGDFRVNPQVNQLAARYCWLGFTRQLGEDGRGVVLFDQGVGWKRLNLDPPIRNLGPDLAVISNLVPDEFDGGKGTYQVTPGTIPNLVVEILSEKTAKYDRGRKKRLYERIGVEQYVLIDVRPKVYKPRFPRLQSFVLQEIVPGHCEYVQQSLDAQGRVFLPSVNLHISVEQNDVYLYRRDGERIPNYEELVADKAQLAAEKDQLAAEKDQLVVEKAQLTADKAKTDKALAQAAAEKAKTDAAIAQALALLNADNADSQEDRLAILSAILKTAVTSAPKDSENGTGQKIDIVPSPPNPG